MSPGYRPSDSNLLRQPGAGPQVPGWDREAPPAQKGLPFPRITPPGRKGSWIPDEATGLQSLGLRRPGDLSKGNLLSSLPEAKGVNQDKLGTLLRTLHQGQSNPHADLSLCAVQNSWVPGAAPPGTSVTLGRSPDLRTSTSWAVRPWPLLGLPPAGGSFQAAQTNPSFESISTHWGPMSLGTSGSASVRKGTCRFTQHTAGHTGALGAY